MRVKKSSHDEIGKMQAATDHAAGMLRRFSGEIARIMPSSMPSAY